MDRWLINIAATNSNEEKVPLSSSERPNDSTCSYLELQPGTSFQFSSHVEDQKEQLDPQTSSLMEDEDDKLVDNCTEDKEEGYHTEDEKKQSVGSKSTKKGMKKIFKKKFQHDWLKLPEFKAWLLNGNRDDNAICKVCNVIMKAGKSELKKHGDRIVHKKNMETWLQFNKNQPSITTFVAENTKLKNIEAAICSYIVENNLPISSIEPLIELIKSLPEMAITSQISLAKQKATNVIRNGLRPFFNQKLVSELNHHLFSVYIDETTDVSVKKQLAILVSYCHNFVTKVDVIDVVLTGPLWVCTHK